MAKPEWGKKHECPNCLVRFYDLLKPSPLTCPECSFVFETDILHRLRKAKAKPTEENEPEEPIEDLEEEDESIEDNDIILPDEEDDDAVPNPKENFTIKDDLTLSDEDEISETEEELPEDLLKGDLEDAFEETEEEKP